MTAPLRAVAREVRPVVSWPRRLYTLVAPGPFSDSLDPVALGEALVGSARELEGEDVQLIVHRFEPQGVSLIVLGARVRAVLHTWPEHGRATLDVSTSRSEPAPSLAQRLVAALPLLLIED